ncbi:MAG: hypothetical protein EOO02_18810 [Chitinophagaceae bacterium]|nr:MAG: hypothetical protein EOO02_18810 [Chitinophagaceae bacterium]
MQYSRYNITTTTPSDFQSVIEECPYGILHVRCQDTGDKFAVLVEVFYSDKKGITCRIAHSQKDLLEELCTEPVSLKLCSREKNIYVVADVTVSPDIKPGLFSRDMLRVAVNKFNFFKKNKSQQMVSFH